MAWRLGFVSWPLGAGLGLWARSKACELQGLEISVILWLLLELGRFGAAFCCECSGTNRWYFQ